MTDLVSMSEFDGVYECVFNRPEKFNAINLAMADALFDAVTLFENRPDLRVLLIRAEGKYFSAGVDLKDEAMFGSAASAEGPAAFRKWYRNGRGSLHPLGDAIEAVEKPVIIVHQGPCLGGALEFSLSCDFRLAGGSASYGLPEISMGVLPGSGGTSRLTRLVGQAWARWLILAAEQVGAEQALAIGLVHKVYPDDSLKNEAQQFARRLAGFPAEAMSAGKLAIDLVADLGKKESRSLERLTNSLLSTGSEHKGIIDKIMKRFN